MELTKAQQAFIDRLKQRHGITNIEITGSIGKKIIVQFDNVRLSFKVKQAIGPCGGITNLNKF